jgi:BASS family bile acid:Na+ symporter
MDLRTIINLLNVAGLILLMWYMGLKVTFEEILESMRRVRLVVAALLANFVVVPAVCEGLLLLFDANPLVSAGLLILAVSPGAPASPLCVAIAKGNVPCSLGLMVILAGLSAVLSPALLIILLGWISPERDLEIDFLAMGTTLLLTQLLPLAVGLALRRWTPATAERLVKPAGRVANLVLLAVLALILISQWETLAAIRLRGWVGMTLLLAASFGIGWLLGGPDRAIRKTLSLTTGIRNAAVGLVIVNANFAGTPAVGAVVAYGLFCIVGGLALAFWMAPRGPEVEPRVEPST